ncbi:MAG: hypothetical protein N3A54_00415 [Patescibacteria group bacterium]|nr:hypothetical protein [Patescibacteria group bacterium]
MANIKLIRITSKDNLSTWAEKTNAIMNLVEDFLQNTGSIISRQTPAAGHLPVWDTVNSEFNNKALIGPIVYDSSYYNANNFKLKPEKELITDLQEKTAASTNDYVMIFDASGNALKKAKISAIQAPPSAAGSNTQVQYNQGGSFGASSGLVFDYNTNTLTVGSGLVVGSNKLHVATSTDNVGIGKVPSYRLDVAGDINMNSGSALRINGTSVLTATTLGSSVVSSSLQSLGVLTSLTVSGTSNLQGGASVSGGLNASRSGSTTATITNTLTSSPSLTWDSAATLIIRTEASELAFGFNTTNGLWIQGRTNTNSSRMLMLQPLGGGVSVPALAINSTTIPTLPFVFSVSGNADITTHQFHAEGIEVNAYGSGNRFAYIDFHAASGSGDYSARLIRQQGTSGDFDLINTSTGSLRFFTNGTERARITGTGNFGINTTNPTSLLHVYSTTTTTATLETNSSSTTEFPNISFIKYSGTSGTPNNSTIGGLTFIGLNTSSTQFQGATIQAVIGTNSSTAAPTELRFSVHSGSALTERVRISSNGNVGIRNVLGPHPADSTTYRLVVPVGTDRYAT